MSHNDVSGAMDGCEVEGGWGNFYSAQRTGLEGGGRETSEGRRAAVYATLVKMKMWLMKFENAKFFFVSGLSGTLAIQIRPWDTFWLTNR